MQLRNVAISFLLLVTSFGTAADEVADAIKDICKCGFPPSQSCIDKLAVKYPRIDQDPTLQRKVMDGAQRDCGMGMPGAARIQAAGVQTSDDDCSTKSFTVEMPEGWQCRKQDHDSTLHTNGNKLNVTLGKSQGKTSCSVIPICEVADFELSDRFATKVYTIPMAGTYEYAGTYKADPTFKLTITSTTKPTAAHMAQIREILESFQPR